MNYKIRPTTKFQKDSILYLTRTEVTVICSELAEYLKLDYTYKKFHKKLNQKNPFVIFFHRIISMDPEQSIILGSNWYFWENMNAFG